MFSRILGLGIAALLCLAVPTHRASAQDSCFGGTAYEVGLEPSDVVIADLNGDGWPDLAVANHYVFLDNRVSVLMNNGDGTFAPSVFYDVGDRPYWLAVGDLNGDGWNDIAVTNYHGLSVSVLINEGGGVFAPHVLYSVGQGPTFIAMALVDANKSLDLIVANAFDATISVLLNNGDGTFARQVNYTVGIGPYGVAAADFNNDGYVDVAVANYLSGEFNTPISVLINNGDGTFARQVLYDAGVASVGLAATDLDNDGFVDLVAANEGFDAQNNTVSVLHNNGDGTFAPHVEYFTALGPYDVQTADFNADGFADLAVGAEQGFVSVLLNNTDGTFGAAANFAINGTGLGVATGDVDGNGTPEIAVASYSSNEVQVLFNQYVGIALQPVDTVAPLGGIATFTVAATGPGPFTYQWRRNGIDLIDGGSISGATTDTLTIDPVSARDAKTYDAIVTNDCGPMLSTSATLTIKAPTCPADLNGDGGVGGADLAILLGNWSGSGMGDLDGNGVINAADLGVLLGSWGPC